MAATDNKDDFIERYRVAKTNDDINALITELQSLEQDNHYSDQDLNDLLKAAIKCAMDERAAAGRSVEPASVLASKTTSRLKPLEWQNYDTAIKSAGNYLYDDFGIPTKEEIKDSTSVVPSREESKEHLIKLLNGKRQVLDKPPIPVPGKKGGSIIPVSAREREILRAAKVLGKQSVNARATDKSEKQTALAGDALLKSAVDKLLSLKDDSSKKGRTNRTFNKFNDTDKAELFSGLSKGSRSVNDGVITQTFGIASNADAITLKVGTEEASVSGLNLGGDDIEAVCGRRAVVEAAAKLAGAAGVKKVIAYGDTPEIAIKLAFYAVAEGFDVEFDAETSAKINTDSIIPDSELGKMLAVAQSTEDRQSKLAAAKDFLAEQIKTFGKDSQGRGEELLQHADVVLKHTKGPKP